jgi:hypothetical protein
MARPFSTFAFERSEVPWGGLAAIAVIALVELVVYQPLWNVLAGRHYADRIVAGKLLYLADSPASDYLLLGDSSVSTNIDAEFLTRHFATAARPMTFLNLGLIGSTSTAGNYFVLERYLETHPKPKAVFLVVSPTALSYPAAQIARVGRLPRFFLSTREIAAYSFFGSDVVCQAVLRKLIASSQWNDFFWSFPREDLCGMATFVRHWKENRDFYSALVARRGFTPVTDRERFDALNPELRLTWINRHFLDLLLRRLQSLDVDVYFSFPSVPRSVLRKLRDNPRQREAREAFYAGLEARGVKRLPLPESLPDDRFGSLYHLKEVSTPDFNRDLAERLATVLDSEGR